MRSQVVKYGDNSIDWLTKEYINNDLIVKLSTLINYNVPNKNNIC